MNESLILTLIDRLEKSGIAELVYDDGTSHLSLRKGGVNSRDETNPDGSAKVISGRGEVITSPIVGTFYPAPGPDAPAFVRPGSKIKTGDTLCILEAMKMMNQLEAEFDCEIIAVRAASGDLVEFGQPLFEVKRLGIPGRK
jgi:acetyl-CoA carboxylase biotin carboxyl carrier protein